MIKVIAFDVLGTVVDLSTATKDEIVGYINHIEKEPWTPLKLPSRWEQLPLKEGAKEALEILKKDYMVVTCSNAPLGFLARLSKNLGISWDAIIPLELNKVFKPSERAYLTVCEVMEVWPKEVLMVTGNPKLGRYPSGDVEYASSVGMYSQLIDPNRYPKNLMELAMIYKLD